MQIPLPFESDHWQNTNVNKNFNFFLVNKFLLVYFLPWHLGSELYPTFQKKKKPHRNWESLTLAYE